MISGPRLYRVKEILKKMDTIIEMCSKWFESVRKKLKRMDERIRKNIVL
jgi:hypothetical protein